MKSNLKLHKLIISLIFLIHLVITSTYAVDRILLVGDSILDNAFWNGVNAETTGQCLVKMLNSSDNIQYKNGQNVLIDDRSVEEATASAIINALEAKGKINIPFSDFDYKLHPSYNFFQTYISRRKINGVAYDSKSKYSARLHQYCKIDETEKISQVDVLSDIENSYIFISAGGNDLVLHSNWPFTIIANLQKIGTFYKKQGAKKVNYIIPYTMDEQAGWLTPFAINACRDFFKTRYLDYFTPEYYDDMIDLSDFDDTYRKSRGEDTLPEPTIKGAKEIAERIINIYELQSNIGEKHN